MKRTLIAELRNNIGSKVKIMGWVHALRDQKNMQFFVIRDHTGLVQVVHERKANPDLAALVTSITLESAVEVEGLVANNENVKLGQIEVVLHDIKIANRSDPQLPI